MNRVRCLLIFALSIVMTLSVAFTSGAASDGVGASSTKGSVVVPLAAGVVVTGVVLLTVSKNSKANGYYKKGAEFAAAGQWDKAADMYLECSKVNPKFKDVQARLAEARDKAEQMFIAMGDAAIQKEQWDNAITFYNKALQYRPASTAAKAKLDGVSLAMVEVLYRRGASFETQNRWEEALAEYDRAMLTNPRYKDLAERYDRAKARLAKKPTWAVLYFVNSSGMADVDNMLLRSLNSELALESKGKIVFVDEQRVKSIIVEQAAGLGASFNDALAMDLGRLTGANSVVVGEITECKIEGDKVKVAVEVHVLEVPSGKVLLTAEYSERITAKGSDGLRTALGEVANKLASKLVK